MIAIIDYGGGNIQSVYKALKFIGCDCKITDNKDEIMNADGAILPGQGMFGDCVNSMKSGGIDKAVKEFIDSGKPFLGICVGLQLLFGKSEESPEAVGLNILEGTIKKIPNGEGLKIPHMGWNNIKLLKNDGIFEGVEDGSYVYFVHSYFLRADERNVVSAQAEYGVEIDAAVSYKNITATQFHPEKSGDVGLRMLRNFVKMCEVG